MTDERAKFHQNVALDFSNALPHNEVHRLAQNILLPQQQAHQHLHQQQLLSHYQAAVAAAQQSLQRVGAQGFIEGSTLDPHHRSPLYPEFYQQQHTQNLAKSLYPKLHEDILNSSKQYQQYYQTRLLTDSVLAKYPPLGNLCKTVSQIGQSSSTPPALNGAKLVSPARSEPSPTKKALKRPSLQLDTAPSTGSLSSDSTSATVSTSSSASNETTAGTTKNHQSNSMDSGLDSSDDTKSETGSNKDEKIWPAWIYCTRYSDRPSSGERLRFLSFVMFVNWVAIKVNNAWHKKAVKSMSRRDAVANNLLMGSSPGHFGLNWFVCLRACQKAHRVPHSECK